MPTAIDERAIDERVTHRQFLDCLEGFYRNIGHELPYFDTDPGSPLAVDVDVDGVQFSVGYDPSAGDARLFVYGRFGSVQPNDAWSSLRPLLEGAAALAREHNATYCLDPVTHEVAYYARCDPRTVDAAWLQEELVRVARLAVRWRTDPTQTGSASAASAQQGSPGQFQNFA